MRTKTVEIPVCGFGKCSREGIVLQVVAPGRQPFLIARCERHLELLAHEHDEDQPTAPTAIGSAVERAAEIVAADPGRSAADYLEAGVSRHALQQAVRAGLVRAEGSTIARRYFVP